MIISLKRTVLAAALIPVCTGIYAQTREPADSLGLEDARVTVEFGLMRSARSVGSTVQSIKAADVADAGRESFVSALQGRAAGMTVTSTTGMPGASTSILLRSASSFTGVNRPLFVVDGVPVDAGTFNAMEGFANQAFVTANNLMATLDFSSRINDFNPEDIESITILKGPAAAALYGSDASDGAVVITTKKGAPGRVRVSYGNSLRWDSAYGYPELQTKYANGWYGATNFYIQSRFGARYPDGIKLYDNYGAVLQTGFSQHHNLSVEGGTDWATVRGAVSCVDQTGVVKTTDYRRLNISLAGRAEAGGWLSFEPSFQYMRTGNTKAPKSSSGVLDYASRWPLTDDMTRYEAEDGKQRMPNLYTDTDLCNPLYSLHKNVNHDDVDRFVAALNLTVRPTKHSFLRAIYGMDHSWGEYKAYIHPYDNVAVSTVKGKGAMNNSKPTRHDSNLDVLAGYDNAFGPVSLSAMAGYHQKGNKTGIRAVYADSLQPDDSFSIDNCDPASVLNFRRDYVRRIQALSAQIVAGFKNMAFLTARARNDWSSTLPRGDNSYLYPAAEASFIVSELPFLKQQHLLSYLKLRAAAAKVGRDPEPLLVYPALEETGGRNGGYNFGLYGPNESLKPEITLSREFGFESSFLDGRINADFSFFKTNNKDQLIRGILLPDASGSALHVMNAGSFTTRGWEFHVDGEILRRPGGLRWTMGLNLDHSTSKVTALPESVPELFDDYTRLSGNLRSGTRVGYPITSISGRKFKRNEKGDILINGENGTPLVSGEWDVLGDRQPKLSYGISTCVSWKGLSLSALLTGRIGMSVVNGTMRDMMTRGYSMESVTVREGEPFIIRGVIQDGNENTDHPTVNTVVIDPASYGSTIYAGADENWIENDVHFLRLAELRISYSLPEKWLAEKTRGFVSAARVYFCGTDLFTLTNYSGLDALGNSNSAALGGVGGVGIDVWGVPAPRGLAIGCSLTF